MYLKVFNSSSQSEKTYKWALKTIETNSFVRTKEDV